MSWEVKSTQHPHVAKGKRHVAIHGPFDTKPQADAYATRLRAAGGWGDVTVMSAGEPASNELTRMLTFKTRRKR